jgi:hypothetical protein
LSSTAGTVSEGSRQDRTRRVHDTGAAAEAKLNSLLEVREGDSALECITGLPPGGMVFIRSSHPDPEGILLVVGQPEAEEKPVPGKAEP